MNKTDLEKKLEFYNKTVVLKMPSRITRHTRVSVCVLIGIFKTTMLHWLYLGHDPGWPE